MPQRSLTGFASFLLIPLQTLIAVTIAVICQMTAMIFTTILSVVLRLQTIAVTPPNDSSSDSNDGFENTWRNHLGIFRIW